MFRPECLEVKGSLSNSSKEQGRLKVAVNEWINKEEWKPWITYYSVREHSLRIKRILWILAEGNKAATTINRGQ